MRDPGYWMVIALAFCLLLAISPVEGAGSGASAASPGYSGIASPGQDDPASSPGGIGPVSTDLQGDPPSRGGGMESTGFASGTDGGGRGEVQDPGTMQDADRGTGPESGHPDSSSGSPGSNPSPGYGTVADGGMGSDTGADTRQSSVHPDADRSGRGKAPERASLMLQEREGTGSPPRPAADPNPSPGVLGVPGLAHGLSPQEERNGVVTPIARREGYLGAVAASAGSAAMMQRGSGDSAGQALPGHERGGPASPWHQQGMPGHSGRNPCAPAQTVPVLPQQPQKETDSRDDSAVKPRSRRERIPGRGDALPSPVLPLPFSLVLFGGYRRISKKNLLEQDTRNLVYQAISNRPGIDVPTLVKETGINENTLRYHLMKLVTNGGVAYLARPGVIRYYPHRGAYSLPEQVLIHYLWADTPRTILRLLRSAPGMTRQEISDLIGIAGPSVTRQMAHLMEDGIIMNRLCGRANHYLLTDEALATFDRLLSLVPEQGWRDRHPLPASQEIAIPQSPPVC